MRLLIAASFFVALGAHAQQVGTNVTPGQETTYTLNVTSQLVVENVVIKDKQGKFITDLKASDFEVTEDGAPQTVRLCEHQHLSESIEPLPSPAADDEQITIYKRLTRTQFASECAAAGGQSRYKDHRLLALYFDMT
jgi:hypothetical protein